MVGPFSFGADMPISSTVTAPSSSSSFLFGNHPYATATTNTTNTTSSNARTAKRINADNDDSASSWTPPMASKRGRTSDSYNNNSYDENQNRHWGNGNQENIPRSSDGQPSATRRRKLSHPATATSSYGPSSFSFPSQTPQVSTLKYNYQATNGIPVHGSNFQSSVGAAAYQNGLFQDVHNK